MSTETTTTTSYARQRKDPLDDPSVNIRLRRINSATSSTTSLRTNTTLPPYSSATTLQPPEDTKNPFLTADDASSISSYDPNPFPERAFKADKTFQINSLGKKCISLPTTSKELEIGIDEFGVEGEGDNGLAERYRNVRPERRKGNCTLFLQMENGEIVPVAETTYRFGPGKPPVMRLFGLGAERRGEVVDEFELDSTWSFKRTVNFESKRFGKLEWRYAGKKEKKAWKAGGESTIKSTPDNLLVLEKVVKQAKGKEREVVEVARMVRNEDCRATGTNASDEGNGGRLEIDFSALMAGGVGGATELVEWGGEEGLREMEVLVLGSVLVMLKKEIDRLRAIQIMVLSGAASGGG